MHSSHAVSGRFFFSVFRVTFVFRVIFLCFLFIYLFFNVFFVILCVCVRACMCVFCFVLFLRDAFIQGYVYFFSECYRFA